MLQSTGGVSGGRLLMSSGRPLAPQRLAWSVRASNWLRVFAPPPGPDFVRLGERQTVGEGAASFVLENYERAVARGADIYAEVLGVAAGCDGIFVETHPRPDEALSDRDANVRRAAVFYLHPWELDPGHPRIDLPRRIALTHYVNLNATERRLRRLLLRPPRRWRGRGPSAPSSSGGSAPRWTSR